MRVLITGAAGFTGQYLTQTLLRAGHHPQPLVSNLLDAAALRSELAETEFDAVAHLAAVSTSTLAAAEHYISVNVTGSRNLLTALERQRKLHTVLMASSGQVYGKGEDLAQPITPAQGFKENDPLSPGNDYARSKALMERLSQEWSSRLPIIIARPFNYTGKGQSDTFVIPKIVHHFRRRAPKIELGATHLWREFGDVRYVSECYRALIERGVQGDHAAAEVYNICSGIARRLDDVLEICRAKTGHDPSITVNPKFVRAGEPEILIGDPSRLQKILNGTPTPTLEQTLSWMLSDGTKTRVDMP